MKYSEKRLIDCTLMTEDDLHREIELLNAAGELDKAHDNIDKLNIEIDILKAQCKSISQEIDAMQGSGL